MSVCDMCEADSGTGYDLAIKKSSDQWAVFWAHANHQRLGTAAARSVIH